MTYPTQQKADSGTIFGSLQGGSGPRLKRLGKTPLQVPSLASCKCRAASGGRRDAASRAEKGGGTTFASRAIVRMSFHCACYPAVPCNKLLALPSHAQPENAQGRTGK